MLREKETSKQKEYEIVLKKFGFTQIIRKFMAEKDIECSIIIDKTEDKESSVRRVILIKPKDEMLNLKLKYLDEFIFEKQKNYLCF